MRALLGLPLAALLLACAGGGQLAPVEVRAGERPAVHLVALGETLYSIAWSYELDHRALARANGIPHPYTIHPGQQLRLGGAGGEGAPIVGKAGAPVAGVAGKAPAVAASAAKPSPAPAAASASGGVPARATTPSPAPSPAPTTKSSTAPRTTASPAPASDPKKATPPINPSPAPATKPSTASAPAPKKSASATPTRWRWPAKGKVVRGFSGTRHKGIDIGGGAGDPVWAAAEGEVVYAGTGIVGYGNLLIVKHGELYLSAYGHNQRLLVQEGARVSAGQRIAEKGSSATNAVKLHFEIRREGQPVNPQRLLPAAP